MSALPLAPGEDVWLVPRTRTAPAAAYRTPKATVTAVAHPYVTVELADGTPVTTHERNIARTRPGSAHR